MKNLISPFVNSETDWFIQFSQANNIGFALIFANFFLAFCVIYLVYQSNLYLGLKHWIFAKKETTKKEDKAFSILAFILALIILMPTAFLSHQTYTKTSYLHKSYVLTSDYY